MSMKINYNVSAMIANNSLHINDNKLTTSLQKLSSGYKINSAKDDAAGLAISRRMNAQLKGLAAASQDAKDGVSVVEIADGALAEVTDILQRMNELAVKSANGTLAEGDREAIQAEVEQLAEEIDRIGQTTEYNGQKLFDGVFDLKGYTNNVDIKVDYYSDANMYGMYEFDMSELLFDDEGNVTKANGSANKLITVLRPDGKNEQYRVSGDMYHLTFNGDNGDEFKLDIAGIVGNEYKIYEQQKKEVPDARVSTGSTTALDVPSAGYTTVTNEYAVGTKFSVTETIVTDPAGNETTTNEYSYNVDPADAKIELNLTGYGAMTLQIGANETQTLDVRVQKLSMESLGFKNQDSDESKDMILNMKTKEGSLTAIDQLDAAINQVNSMRSKLGAYQNRLEHTESNLATSEENVTAAYSRIMDTDMAEEMSNYTNLQIISQAATSILAQANERPSQMLQLLQ